MQGKDHKESSVIGLALGVVVAALTAWLVMLLRQRTQPANNTRTTEALPEGMAPLETKSISTQDNQMESATASESTCRSGTSLPVQRRCGLFIRKKNQDMESAHQVHDWRGIGHLHPLGFLF